VLLAGGRASLILSGLGRAPAARAASSARAPRRIRIGQIGVGHGHAGKLAVFRASPDYEVVGIVETDPELRAKAVVQPAFRDLTWMTREQLLEAPGLEAVLVETRVGDALDAAEACVAAGKHIHLDKPPGASLLRFRRVLDEAAGRKLLVQLGYMYRYNPAVVLMRRMLSRGWLGEPFEVHAVMSKVVEPPERKRLAEFRGGMMFELGCHLIDLVVGALGKPGSVTAFSQHAGVTDDGLADNTLAVFQYPRALASVKSSALEPDGFARRHLVVCGTEGTFHIQPLDNPVARVTLSRARDAHPKGTQEIQFPRYQRYVDDAADMARILRGEKASDYTYAHDLDVQETVLRASGMPLDT
jgi:predicted dehydrogenase